MKRSSIMFGAAALVLSGCSSIGDDGSGKDGLAGFGYALPERNVAVKALNSARPCCGSLSQLDYIPTQIGKGYPTLIDSSSQVFAFKSGLSYVAAYALPATDGIFTVEIQTEAKDALYKPNVLMLDANFNPVRQISADKFYYSPLEMLKPNTYDLMVKVDRSYVDKQDNEYYMVLFTTTEDLKGTSRIKTEEAIHAERTSRIAPPNSRLNIPHSPQGVVKIFLHSGVKKQPQGLLRSALSGLFGGDEEGQVEPITAVDVQQNVVGATKGQTRPIAVPATPAAGAPAVQTIPVQPVAHVMPDATPVEQPELTRPAAVIKNAAMQPETEDFYNQLIQQKVNDKQIDKALKLVEEAERAGSKTARSYFVNAVKQLN